MKQSDRERGFALITVLMLMTLLAAILAAYYMLSRVERSTTRSSMDSTRGFYAAEAGLNFRAEQIRQKFIGYNRPSGTTPADLPGQLPCQGGPAGTGDMACQTLDFGYRDALTYVVEAPGNPTQIVIPPGELYANLSAQEYLYIVRSLAVRDNNDDRPEAALEMHFRSRLVPLFQFAAFYNKDLEIYPGPPMTLGGPVHTNGDLYLGAGDSLVINGHVTASHDGGTPPVGGRLFNGRKYDDCCSTAAAQIWDGATPASLPISGGRREVTPSDQTAWNGWIRTGGPPVTVPTPEVMDPAGSYFDLADIRVMYDVDDARLEWQDASGNYDAANSATLTATCGSVGFNSSGSNTFWNTREAKWIDMMEIDVTGLLDCLEANPGLIGGKLLDDTTQGGLVWYFGFEDGLPLNTPNSYGVRVTNGAELAPTSGLIEIQGLTVVTNQAVYIEGDYNSEPTNWKPAAFMADSLNVLSNSWMDTNSDQPLGSRLGSDTAIYAAFLAGTDSTAGVELSPQTGSASDVYNGGLENYPRFHENWSGQILTYRGSFVSLNVARHALGSWDDQDYSPPDRDWGFESRFNDAATLPPLSPRFVYLKQELFVREFEY